MRRGQASATVRRPASREIPYMVRPKPSPRVALSRWLAQLHYNSVRNIETINDEVNRVDSMKPLRGFPIATDLVLTRKRMFYKIIGVNAVPISIEEVSANYNLEEMQRTYRAAIDAWKASRRRVSP